MYHLYNWKTFFLTKTNKKLNNWVQLCALLGAVFFLMPSLSAQSSLTKFVTPPFISGCNNDTIRIEVQNLYGSKSVVYSGKVHLTVAIPNSPTIQYVGGSVASSPSGATSSTANAASTLDIDVPLPALGKTTVVKFVVRADCGVLKLSPLPQFTATVTYPTPYPVTSETINSAVLSVGNAQLSNTTSANNLYSIQGFGNEYVQYIRFANTGYGSVDNVKVTVTTPTIQTNKVVGIGVLSTAGVATYPPGFFPTEPSIVTTIVGSNTVRVYTLSGSRLGADNLFTPGETLFFNNAYNAPSTCGVYDTQYKLEYSCAGGGTSCDVPQTFTYRTTVSAGTPKLDGTLVSVEYPDGCPKKNVVYKVKNNATGNGAPDGNAYDVNLNINMGGGLATFTNIKLNGVLVPIANLSTTASATSVTINLKDLKTTDPDGAGGISDLDGDGFFDDMKVGDETTVSFEYSIPCDLACGANLYYQFGSNATFTDFCRNLVGSTATPLANFGFQQVQAIEQTPNVDYGFFTAATAPVTKLAHFNFQYKAVNMDMAAATAKLVINYSKTMEVDASTIKINGVAVTNAPVLQGTGATFGGAAGVADIDSAWVVNLTAAETAALFDATPDQLDYNQTRYSCDVNRQNIKNGDSWQLIVSTKPGLCTDGSVPCAFDIACKKPFAYTYNQGCGDIPCYVVGQTIERAGPSGFTSVAQTTPINPIDKGRSWTSDTVRVTQTSFINSDDPQEPVGYWVNKSLPTQDLRTYFSLLYTKPTTWNGTNNIWKFLPGTGTGGNVAGSSSGSKICVRQRTPNPANINLPGTIGAVIFEAPLLLEDFNNGSTYANTQSAYAINTGSQSNTAVNGTIGWLCVNDPNSYFVKNLCPVNLNYGDNSNNISYRRYSSLDGTKVRDIYNISVAKALQRAGFVGQAGEDNYYFEVKSEWKMDETFPWDNSSAWSVYSGTEHRGNNADTRNFGCGLAETSHLTVTKNISVENPKTTYNADCGLDVCNILKFNSVEGNYFQVGEVRVPYKLDKVVVNVPSEYGIIGGSITNEVNQSCALTAMGTINASASTGAVTFTNAAGGDFPRMDDCAGNKTAYKLCYKLQKTGSAAPAAYKMPIAYYVTDEYGKQSILLDTAFITEADPILTLTPLSASVTIADGTTPFGKVCTPFYTDYKITNNTLFDAPNVYLGAKGGATVTITGVNDVNTATPILPTDVTTYSTTNKFAKVGTVKAGDTRIIRVYATTTVCSGKVDVCADFGCTYPVSNEPDPLPANTNLVTATTNFTAEEPAMQSKPISNMVVTDFCATKTVEFEILNTVNPNLFKMLSTLTLPAGVSLVAGSVKMTYNVPGNNSVNVAIPSANITGSGTSYTFDYKDNSPFKTTECGLPGSDERPSNYIRVKFDVEFTACPVGGAAQLLFKTEAENYCGKKVTTTASASLDFVGAQTPQNNFDLSKKDSPINICSPKIGDVTQVNDIIYVKNIGGYGANSGATTGSDTAFISFPYSSADFDLTDITLGDPTTFGSFPIGTDQGGAPRLKIKIPSGLAVGDSVAVVVSYKITPKVAKLCQIKTVSLCIYGEFRSVFEVGCALKGISCKANRITLSKGLVPRSFKCCYGSIGDYVWFDTDKNGQQGTAVAEPPIVNTKVYLYQETTPGTYIKFDSTFTDNTGKYLFDSLFSGNYKVRFTSTSYLPTAYQSGTNTSDSDNGVNGYSAVVNIDATLTLGDIGRDNLTIDAGFICPVITTPSATQNVCIGASGSNITVNTDASKIKFVKFTTAQAGTAMYTGGTALVTVTPSSGVATYTWNSADFPNATFAPITYYVYAILDVVAGASCQPFQEIQVTVNPLPSFTLAQTNVTCNGAANGKITTTTISGTTPFTYSKDDGATFPNTDGIFDNLTPATYKIAVKDANGCVKKCN